MSNNGELEKLKTEFNRDTQIVAEESVKFINTVHPAYLYGSKSDIMELSYKNPDEILDNVTFYRIASCTIEKKENIFEFLNEKIEKFYTALYSVGKPIIYGIVSYEGRMNIVVGVYDSGNNDKLLKNIIEGLLDGVELFPFKMDLSKKDTSSKEVGLISGIPSIKVGEEKQKFSLTSMMKSLNGQDYIVLFISRPLSQENIAKKQEELLEIRDNCFAVSKRSISRQQGASRGIGATEGETRSTTQTKSKSKNGWSVSFIVTKQFGKNEGESKSETKSTNYSKTITDTINRNVGISGDVQNSFALTAIDYADQALNRLRQGKNSGMWETAISYSTNSELVAEIIKASVYGEFAKPNPNILPPAMYSFHLDEKEAKGRSILLPKIMMGEIASSNLCTAVTSGELGQMSTLPDVPVPNFELRKCKALPLITDNASGINVGNVCDGKRSLYNMPFSLTYKDLARHTFVCGITGSGKTTTVKGILQKADTPFLVIESAKKEYRNIKLKSSNELQIYTLGKPELNCLRFNPFYIQCGVSPQTHIDYLKDLFNASFSFYGPMPYILEKCLQNVYKNKGWNLTLGFHPYLANSNDTADFFDEDIMKKKYQAVAHKYLFPTMEELKLEIERYIKEEMDYEGDVAGNIKTAIKARLESLCSGAKGYMFNTHEYADMESLLTKDTVFELEGLSDDSDKAFCVGLLIIFINEYRQISKEITKKDKDLLHILVVEEAHRLLKNINTERMSEDMGNPKGKAVEHFTNMIAEMRSYGQGVIVAEQIPSKLAPDVIKNSSNKIIQRLVAADDQELIANTIGLSAEEGLELGTLTVGSALCHKEGMALPVKVQIPMSRDEDKITDTKLYENKLKERFNSINVNLVKEALQQELDLISLKMLNTILIQDYETFREAIKKCRKFMRSQLIKKDVNLVDSSHENSVYAEVLSESIIDYLLNGVYSVNQLISDDLCKILKELLNIPSEEKFQKLKYKFKEEYNNEDPEYQGNFIIAQLVYHQSSVNTDIIGTIKKYFFDVSDSEIRKIKYIMERR